MVDSNAAQYKHGCPFQQQKGYRHLFNRLTTRHLLFPMPPDIVKTTYILVVGTEDYRRFLLPKMLSGSTKSLTDLSIPTPTLEMDSFIHCFRSFPTP